MNDGSKVLRAFIIGAAVGGVLGLLFAPMSGAEMRDNITSTADEVTGNLKRKAEEGMNYAKNLKSKASGKINELLNREKEEGADLS